MSKHNGSSVPPLRGPAERVLAVFIARRHYLEGLTKVEIAEELQLSRFKVARLLDAARREGLIRIEIGAWEGVDVELSSQLVDAFGLRHAVVVASTKEDPVALRRSLGQASASLLSEIASTDDVLGLAWARTVQAMATQLTSLPPIPVVQLTGALTSTTAASSSIEVDSSVDIVREVARVAGGPAYLFYAPFLASDPAAARALQRQPDVARAFRKIATVTIAQLAIGAWAPGSSTLYEDATPEEQALLISEGVCAEMAGVFLTPDGTVIHSAMSDRMVAVDGDRLRDIGLVIASAYRTANQPAVLAALRSGLVSALVTHTSLAQALLDTVGPRTEAR